jgi:hypothetical protein
MKRSHEPGCRRIAIAPSERPFGGFNHDRTFTQNDESVRNWSEPADAISQRLRQLFDPLCPEAVSLEPAPSVPSAKSIRRSDFLWRPTAGAG